MKTLMTPLPSSNSTFVIIDRLHGSAEVLHRYIHFVTEELSISETNYAGLRGRPRFAELYCIERGWAIMAAKNPVCSMEVDEKKVATIYEYKGNTLFLCSGMQEGILRESGEIPDGGEIEYFRGAASLRREPHLHGSGRRYWQLSRIKANITVRLLQHVFHMRRSRMKKLIVCLHLLSISALGSSQSFAQMNTGQGGGMMGNGWGWGMGFGSGWVFMIIIAILVVLGIVYFMKRR
jgi:hypothetical protein